MIRNLKILVAAAFALSALGAMSATAAHAEDIFHCSANPCRLRARGDGTGATAHQVFIVENEAKTESVSFTCHDIHADAEVVGNTTKEVTATGIEYTTCTVNGSPGVTVDMNGCHYKFTSGNVGTEDKAEVHIECPTEKKIQVTVSALGCTFEIGPQTVTGVGYQTIGTSPNREVTLTAKNVGPISTTVTPGCPLINQAQKLIGTYTTGNAIITGETTPGEVMADAWYGT